MSDVSGDNHAGIVFWSDFGGLRAFTTDRSAGQPLAEYALVKTASEPESSPSDNSFDLPSRLRETTEMMASACSVDMHLWCAHSAAALSAALKIETLNRENEKLNCAHDALWRALTAIIEVPGRAPNATVRRMAALAEKALIEDRVAGIVPEPRFYKS